MALTRFEKALRTMTRPERARVLILVCELVADARTFEKRNPKKPGRIPDWKTAVRRRRRVP